MNKIIHLYLSILLQLAIIHNMNELEKYPILSYKGITLL